jgi:hypothetical protein
MAAQRYISIVPIIVIGVGLVGCTTQAGRDGQSRGWQIDAVTQKCVGAVVVGTGIGAVIGALAGGGRGAAIGAGAGLLAGGVTCAVIASLDAQDRENIKRAQLEAARTGHAQDLSYSGSDGLPRRIRATPRPTTQAAAPSRPNVQPASQTSTPLPAGPICRLVDTSASVATKGNAEIPPQKFCRTPNGDYEPVADTAT